MDIYKQNYLSHQIHKLHYSSTVMDCMHHIFDIDHLEILIYIDILQLFLEQDMTHY